MKKYSIFSTAFLSFLFVFIATSTSLCSIKNGIISVKVTPFRAEKGDTVTIEIEFNQDEFSKNSQINAIFLKPTQGKFDLPLRKLQGSPGRYRGNIVLSNDSPEGLYSVHAWTGSAGNSFTVGKASFLAGKIVADFFIASIADNENPENEISQYLKSFQEVSGNFIIAHALIGRDKAYYPSNICKNDIKRGYEKDIVETLLRLCDKMGFPVLLSVSWDLTGNTPSRDRMAEIKSIIKEMYSLYSHHPSFVGFYSYQEGSGTYFAPFIREFCSFVKTVNPGLLTACAPYVDDPLLAGYLSIIEPLDIIIFQGMVMASYRPDNRKKYPLRRVKDFCSVGIGAKWLQNKIALTHVEFFGYLENRISKDNFTTTYKNIYSQIVSAATAAANDGISFFTYSTNIYKNGQKAYREIRESRKAVLDGMQAFNLIRNKISKQPSPLALYYPYSDWVIERWHNCYLPALDAFRRLGIPIDFLPFAPPTDEDYPYYPLKMNKAFFTKVIKKRKILVLPDVSGFHLTDSDLIESFVTEGGVVIAFGPQIPMGNSYDRSKLFGLDEIGKKEQSSIQINEAIGVRAKVGYKRYFPSIQLPLWKSTSAKTVASFADGSPAVTVNNYGRGMVMAITLDAETASRHVPNLIRDIIDYAMSACNLPRMVDILDTNENVDVVVSGINKTVRVAVMNHNNHPLEITLRALYIPEGSNYEWFDLISQKKVGVQIDEKSWKLEIPALKLFCLEYR